MHAALHGGRFLTEAELLPAGPDAGAELGGERRDRFEGHGGPTQVVPCEINQSTINPTAIVLIGSPPSQAGERPMNRRSNRPTIGQRRRRSWPVVAGLAIALACLPSCGSSDQSGAQPTPTTRARATSPTSTSRAKPTPATTSPPTTTTAPPPPAVPDVVVAAVDSGGDSVRVTEDIARPVRLDQITGDGAGIANCPGVDDRTVIVAVKVEMTVESSLPVTVSAGFGLGGVFAFLNYSDGPACSGNLPDGGSVRWKDAQPGRTYTFGFWYPISNAITPNDPTGEHLTASELLNPPGVTLPVALTKVRSWGLRVYDCKQNDPFPKPLVWLAGPKPDRGTATDPDPCPPAFTEATAVQAGH